MGCPCQEKNNKLGFSDDVVNPDYEQGEFFDVIVRAIMNIVQMAYDEGFRAGARTMVDTTELVSASTESDTEKLEDLVEADAVALDSVIAQLQDISLRLEAIELTLGLKYVP